jgi:hypothetical protein
MSMVIIPSINKIYMYNFVILSIVKEGVINMGTKIFNGLPIELKYEMNLNVFKRKLKGYLLCNVCYSLQEFFNK